MFDERYLDSLRARYGDSVPIGHESLLKIEPLLRRRSVRRFSDQSVSEEDVRALIAAAQSAATSSNLQLWSVVSVQDAVRRAEIARMCADQKQVHQAQWFFAFFADHHRLRVAAQAVGEDAAGLDFTEFFVMAVIDAALAAERMSCAADLLGMGTCYIGALRNDPVGVAEFFGLPPGVFGLFGLCVGYPDPASSPAIKPRLPQESVWHRESYSDERGVGDFDERMASFYESQRMSGSANWSARSGKRVDGSAESLTGRGVLKDWFVAKGFMRR